MLDYPEVKMDDNNLKKTNIYYIIHITKYIVIYYEIDCILRKFCIEFHHLKFVTVLMIALKKRQKEMWYTVIPG